MISQAIFKETKFQGPNRQRARVGTPPGGARAAGDPTRAANTEFKAEGQEAHEAGGARQEHPAHASPGGRSIRPPEKRKGSEAGEDQPELAAGFRCRIPSSRRRAQEQVLEVLAAGQDLAHV